MVEHAGVTPEIQQQVVKYPPLFHTLRESDFVQEKVSHGYGWMSLMVDGDDDVDNDVE
jgi:hypothetical protein